MKTKTDKIINTKIEFGFSLIESMMALSLLSVVVILFTYFSSTRMTQIKSSYHKTCLQTSQDIMDKIKSVGIVKSVNTINVTNNTIARPSNLEERLNFISNAEDWIRANERLWETSGGALILKNHKALVGSMSLLNSLYNSDASFCTNAIGKRYQSAAATADLIENTDVGHLKDVESRIRIQTMNLSNGSLSCQSPPIIIRPAGVNINRAQTEQFLSGDVRPEPGSRANLGFFVTVRTAYKDDQNNDLSCEVSSSFNYPKIPPDEDLTSAVTVSIAQRTIDTCATSIAADVSIVAPANFKTSKAISLVCRDASEYGGDPAGAPRCPGGAIREMFSVENRRWVNCNQVTLCGVPPNNPTAAETDQGYNLVYSGMSFGCNMAIEVRAIDAAHNITRSPSSGSTPLPAELPGCLPCTGSYTGVGYCPPRTMLNSCTLLGAPVDGGGGGDSDGGEGDGGDTGRGDSADGDDNG